MLKNLQKQNFYDAMKIMSSNPSWAILEENNLLALKSPARIPLVNTVWGEPSVANIKKAKEFYLPKPFSWVLTPQQQDILLLNTGFKGPDLTYEMVINLNDYAAQKYDPAITIIEVKTKQQLFQWAQLVGETFELNTHDVIEFFKPFIDVAGDVPFLALYNNEPAATSLVFCSGEIAGIYAMSTRAKFRRRGLGTAAVQACLDLAKSRNMKNAVLYASMIGKFLYEKIGFQTVQELNEYFYKP